MGSRAIERSVGHRHTIDRRTLFRVAGGGTVAAVLGPSLAGRSVAHAGAYDDPKPIPRGIAGEHGPKVFPPGRPPTNPESIWEPSSITDFKGTVGIMQVQGEGIGTDKRTGRQIPLAFDTDMRFMKGTYVAEDGVARPGTFGFV